MTGTEADLTLGETEDSALNLPALSCCQLYQTYQGSLNPLIPRTEIIFYIYTYIYNNTYYIVNPKQNGKVDPYSISGESLFYLFWWVIVYIYCNIYIYIPIWTIHDFIWNGRRASSMRFGNGWCMLVRWVTCCTTFWVCCPRSRAITVRTVGQL
jgi:hypothetical protein